jgi:glycosyltransferase involved in cell wall biosynthesis
MVIDVILPTYNRCELLERSINSVLKQTHADFQLYVIDDGSTDDTEKFMGKFVNSPKVHYLRQDNKGVSSARNLGVKSSSSEWITFLDSDDEWHSRKLEVQAEFIKKNPATRFVHSNEIWVRNGVRVNPKKKFDKSNYEIFLRSLQTCLISPSTVMIRRDLLEQHGLFNEEFIICEDYDLWLKILAEEEVGFIPDNLVTKYGGHPDQLSTKYPAMDYWRIKSLITLSMKPNLDPTKKEQVLSEIDKKSPILLAGFEKHQNLTDYKNLTELLKLAGR